MHLDVGDVNTALARVDRATNATSTLPKRGASGAATSALLFDRIHINNVPDYSGLLPVMTQLLPRLKPLPASWLTCGILNSATLHQTAAEYAHAHLLVYPGARLEALLGARAIRGSIWGADFFWQRVPGPHAERMAFDGTITPGKLCAWLRALLALTALPPARPLAAMVNHWPHTLVMWWHTLAALAARVPPHWLASLIEIACASEDAPCKAAAARLTYGSKGQPQAPIGSWPAGEGAPQDTYDLGVVCADLRASRLLCAHMLPAPLRALCMRGASAGDALVRVSLPVAPLPDLKQAQQYNESGNGSKLGVVLMHPDEAERRGCIHAQHDDAFSMMRKRTSPATFKDVSENRGEGNPEEDRLQLLSCASWDTEGAQRTAANLPDLFSPGASFDCTPEPESLADAPSTAMAVQFWLLEADLERFAAAGWFALPVATDVWRAVAPAAAPLDKASVAQRVHCCQDAVG